MTRTEVGVMPHVISVSSDKDMTLDDWWNEPRKVAGVAIPVFSLRSKESWGIGDFGDLLSMVKWAESVGMGAVQILPIYDTTATHSWTDSYPYNSISIYALHPIYLQISKSLYTPSAETEKERKRLNALPQIDYEAVSRLKWEVTKELYEKEGAKTMRSVGFKRFYEKNEHWLRPYAVFSYLRDKFGTAEFGKWDTLSTYNEEEVADLSIKHKKEVGIYYFVQYLLHIQLLEVANYARKNSIVLKGDIPIGISRNSVEAWKEPQYFNMDCDTGAPPDTFCDDGQNWGFPTYNWLAMSLDGYRWWTNRMRKMAEYFSAYRIDHILGFFRIWEIPHNRPALEGHFSPALPMTIGEIESYGVKFREELFIADKHSQSTWHPRIDALKNPVFLSMSEEEKVGFARLFEEFFYHRHNQFWYDEAMKKLPVLTRSTQMIVCGEDLGMIPECVPWVMKGLGILSLEIQSMPKVPWHEFGMLKDYPWLSVCTISSHDTPTLRGWWKEDKFRSQRYYNNFLGIYGDAPADMPAWLAENIIRQHLECPSIMCILTLQDWLATDEVKRNQDVESERINVPSNPRHYWRWRMHLTIDDLKDREFTDRIKKIITDTKRNNE